MLFVIYSVCAKVQTSKELIFSNIRKKRRSKPRISSGNEGNFLSSKSFCKNFICSKERSQGNINFINLLKHGEEAEEAVYKQIIAKLCKNFNLKRY